MKIQHIKTIFIATMLSVTMLFLLCCSKSDDYKKYLEGGEIAYTGKIDSVKIYSGNERVYITGLFMADPKVERLKIYWDNRKDSTELKINRTTGVDTLKLSLKISEGVHNFELITFDAQGNKSLSVFRTGVSYGERFSSGLINRPSYSADYFAGDQKTTVNWGGIDLTSGAQFTEVEYTNTAGKLVVQRDSIKFGKSVLANFLPGKPFRYRTLFVPDSLSIDTFYTNYSANILPKEVYLKNMNFPFETLEMGGDRWGTPAYWLVNEAAKNYRTSEVKYYGGIEIRDKKACLSLEAGWWQWASPSPNLAPIVNGKIYQTTNLQPGKYRFTVSKIDKGSAGVVNLLAAKGNRLPDQADLNTAISYKTISGNQAILEFTVIEAGSVTLGFLGNMNGTASDGSYFKVSGNMIFEKL
ncbi:MULTISPECIES: DUF4998 domain-containing protein [Sphingobacterium]|uniref:DUF5013 domain-containing protein n=1 Tax=Sphingobacterium athyrii TaxID=2152717 RepID=A0A363NLU3_9SPHI|nr:MULTISPECIES: DUF4998 domain-containing protein [Sphingobacterium]PUV21796.1 hypothetical protein DCO56_26080 [Sphingobacterium athyrii]